MATLPEFLYPEKAHSFEVVERRSSTSYKFLHMRRGKQTLMKNNAAIFYAGIAIVVIAVALGVLYLIPNVIHPLTTTHYIHRGHAGACFALALVGAVCAYLARPAKSLAK
jgi:hypothetical protein